MNRRHKGESIPPSLQRTRLWAILPAFVLLSACSSNFGFPGSASSEATDTAALWRIFFLVAASIGALVGGLILWSALRYRRRSDELPRQTLYNIPIELAYTIIPLAIVAFLFATSMRATSKVTGLVDNPDLTVDVTGFQWQWRFAYPEQGIDIVGQTDRPAEMVVPVGAVVRIELTATDVIHAFYVPEFSIKKDAIPGRTTAFDIKVTKPGTYDSGRCAEYCGLNHYKMSFTVRAVSQDEFDDWAASQ